MTPLPRYLLVDAHSVIFHWEDLRRLHQSNPRQAREELTRRMQLLHDQSEWLVTLVFDGTHGGASPKNKAGQIAILYGTSDQTADSIIERLVGKAPDPGQVTVVTADGAERETVLAMGAHCFSPQHLLEEVVSTGKAFEKTLNQVHQNARWKQ